MLGLYLCMPEHLHFCKRILFKALCCIFSASADLRYLLPIGFKNIVSLLELVFKTKFYLHVDAFYSIYQLDYILFDKVVVMINAF